MPTLYLCARGLDQDGKLGARFGFSAAKMTRSGEVVECIHSKHTDVPKKKKGCFPHLHMEGKKIFENVSMLPDRIASLIKEEMQLRIATCGVPLPPWSVCIVPMLVLFTTCKCV